MRLKQEIEDIRVTMREFNLVEMKFLPFKKML